MPLHANLGNIVRSCLQNSKNKELGCRYAQRPPWEEGKGSHLHATPRDLRSGTPANTDRMRLEEPLETGHAWPGVSGDRGRRGGVGQWMGAI